MDNFNDDVRPRSVHSTKISCNTSVSSAEAPTGQKRGVGAGDDEKKEESPARFVSPIPSLL